LHGFYYKKIKCLKRYYKNPNHCDECEDIIEIGENQVPSEIKNLDYCSKSCSNSAVPRRNKSRLICDNCNKKFDKPKDKNGRLYKVKYCPSCYEGKLFIKNKIAERTLAELKKNTKRSSRHKYTPVRKHARKVLKEEYEDKKCEYCGFDYKVHVCHIKAIQDFSDNTKVKVINSLDNLILLCPNHHAMQENGDLRV
jgi:hypothetical protein